MKFHKGNASIIKPFKLVQADKTSAVDLTGRTLKWFWVDREDAQPSGSPITGVIQGDPTLGLVNFTIPATILSIEGKYISYINASQGAYNEDFKPINVQVVEGSP
jgi:hypothetical protein